MFVRKVNFHPDDMFEDYVSCEGCINTFTIAECAIYNRLMDESFKVCKREGVDFWKYLGDGSIVESGMSEEAKRIIEYAKKFCIVSKLNDLYLKMTYLSLGCRLKELTKDLMKEVDVKVRNGIGWNEFYGLFKDHKIECWFFSSYTIREFIMKNYIVNNNNN